MVLVPQPFSSVLQSALLSKKPHTSGSYSGSDKQPSLSAAMSYMNPFQFSPVLNRSSSTIVSQNDRKFAWGVTAPSNPTFRFFVPVVIVVVVVITVAVVAIVLFVD